MSSLKEKRKWVVYQLLSLKPLLRTAGIKTVEFYPQEVDDIDDLVTWTHEFQVGLLFDYEGTCREGTQEEVTMIQDEVQRKWRKRPYGLKKRRRK